MVFKVVIMGCMEGGVKGETQGRLRGVLGRDYVNLMGASAETYGGLVWGI